MRRENVKRVGYVHLSIDDSYIKEQIKAVKNWEVKDIIVNQSDIELLHPGDELVVYELKSLGKTVVQLATFLSDLNKQRIKLTLIKKEDFMSFMDEEKWTTLLFDLAEIDSYVICERTTKGIQAAKSKGRIGGRPKVSDVKVEKIRYLHKKNGCTLREIAEECDVSLGTAYKYIQKNE